MTTKAITLKNYYKADTADLEDAAAALANVVNDRDADLTDPAVVKAGELLTVIEDELDLRELEHDLPSYDDTPSLADEGIELGSYAS